MKLTNLLDRIVIEAESPMESQLLAVWTDGEVRLANSGWHCNRGYPGPHTACWSFAPKSAERVRREKVAAIRYRVSNAWRRLRSFRVRLVNLQDEQ